MHANHKEHRSSKFMSQAGCVLALTIGSIPVIVTLIMLYVMRDNLQLIGWLVIGAILILSIGVGMTYIRNLWIDGSVKHMEASKMLYDQLGNPGYIYNPKKQAFILPPAGAYTVPVNVPNTIRLDSRAGAIAELSEANIIDQPVPTFSELFEKKRITPEKLFLGFTEDNNELTGSWQDVYSIAIAGMSGSGKTSFARFLAAQAALVGGRFVIIDPHMHVASEQDSLAKTLMPLSRQFVCEPAGRAKEMMHALKLAENELARRRNNPEAPTTPFILAIDEYSSLMRLDGINQILSKILLDISQEGRKMGIFALCMAQIWKGSTVGGTEVRDSFTSSIVFRMKPGQARLLLPSDEVAGVDRLPKGQGIFFSTTGELHRLRTPYTTKEDIASVAGYLSAPKQPEPLAINPAICLPFDFQSELLGDDWQPTGNQPESTNQALQSDKPLNGEDAMIVSLFAQGKQISEIAKELGATSGRNYTAAVNRIQEVLRRNMRVA